jgi:hypothetical protein
MIRPFDITCTATLRPELLERTLSSHVKYLFKECIEKARFIINIDIAGEEDKNKQDKLVEDILRIIDYYPFTGFEMRIGNPPHFPSAFLWCMEQAKSELLFHLEEDWELTMPIDFNKMHQMFYQYKDLVHLRLSQFTSTDRIKMWNKFVDHNGDFFEVNQDLKGVIGWCGHPGFTRTKFMKDCLEFIDPKINPEKQIKGRRYVHPINTIVNMSKFGCFHPKNSPPAVIDIGREWMVKNNFKKKGNKAFFVEWEKINQ